MGRAFHGKAFGEAFQRVLGGAVGGLVHEALNAGAGRNEDQSAPPRLHLRPDGLRQLKGCLDADVHRGLEGGEAGILDRLNPQDGGIVDQGVDGSGQLGDGGGGGGGVRKVHR